MNTYLWLGIMIVSIVIELATPSLVAIWFAPSALISMILSVFNVHVAVQIAVFVAVSAILMLLFYKKLKDNLDTKVEKTNLDAIIGKEGICEEDIGEMSPGRVKIGGMSWAAYTENGLVISKGDKIRVVSIDGVKLLCEKVQSKETISN